LDQTRDLAEASPTPANLPHELAKEVLPDYFLEPGDRVLLEPIALDSEFRSVGDQKIQVDGSIDLGEFGRIRLDGMTVEQAEIAVQEQVVSLGGEREQFNVQLVETNAAHVYVLGEVGSPGTYSIDGSELVLDAILKAGGLTSKASPCDILLVRPTDPCDCRVVLPVCYRELTQMGSVATNYQLQPGDRIFVGGRSLKEEITFWKQTSSCDRCCRSECAECVPRTASYDNRFFMISNPFALPTIFKKKDKVSQSISDASTDVQDDESLFLNEAQKEATTGGASAPVDMAPDMNFR
jgi:protein involved in polysaccharide export with SLBB domain